jgi:hypothetical protein
LGKILIHDEHRDEDKIQKFIQNPNGASESVRIVGEETSPIQG